MTDNIPNLQDMLVLLSREYLSKVDCCDECFAEFYCIENNCRRGRVPHSLCPKLIIDHLSDRVEKCLSKKPEPNTAQTGGSKWELSD